MIEEKDKPVIDAVDTDENKANVLILGTDEPTKQEMVRASREIGRNMQLGYKPQFNKGVQLDLFGELEKDNPRQLEVIRQEWKSEHIGIDVDADGWDIVEVFYNLLHNHGNHTNQERKDYYTGDANLDKVKQLDYLNWGNMTLPIPKLTTSFAEMTKIRKGSTRISGKDIKQTKAILEKYAVKNHLFELREYYKLPGSNKTLCRKFYTWEPLYRVMITEDEGLATTIVKLELNPVFCLNIREHYTLRPINWNAIIKKAYVEVTGCKQENPDLPGYLLGFLNQLLDAQHNKNCNYHIKKIGTDERAGMFDKINKSWVKKRMWQKLEDTLDVYIQVAKKIGLLKDFWRTGKGKDEVLNFTPCSEKEWKNMHTKNE